MLREIWTDRVWKARPWIVVRDDPEPELVVDTVPCPFCKQPVYDNAEWCPHCRNYLFYEGAPPGEKPWWARDYTNAQKIRDRELFA